MAESIHPKSSPNPSQPRGTPTTLGKYNGSSVAGLEPNTYISKSCEKEGKEEINQSLLSRRSSVVNEETESSNEQTDAQSSDLSYASSESSNDLAEGNTSDSGEAENDDSITVTTQDSESSVDLTEHDLPTSRINRLDPRRRAIKGNHKADNPFNREQHLRKAFRHEKNLSLDQTFLYRGPQAAFDFLLVDFIKTANPVDNMGQNNNADAKAIEAVMQSKFSKKLEEAVDKEIKKIKDYNRLPDTFNPDAPGITNEERSKRTISRLQVFAPIDNVAKSLQEKHKLTFSSDLLNTIVSKNLYTMSNENQHLFLKKITTPPINQNEIQKLATEFYQRRLAGLPAELPKEKKQLASIVVEHGLDKILGLPSIDKKNKIALRGKEKTKLIKKMEEQIKKLEKKGALKELNLQDKFNYYRNEQWEQAKQEATTNLQKKQLIQNLNSAYCKKIMETEGLKQKFEERWCEIEKEFDEKIGVAREETILNLKKSSGKVIEKNPILKNHSIPEEDSLHPASNSSEPGSSYSSLLTKEPESAWASALSPLNVNDIKSKIQTAFIEHLTSNKEAPKKLELNIDPLFLIRIEEKKDGSINIEYKAGMTQHKDFRDKNEFKLNKWIKEFWKGTRL